MSQAPHLHQEPGLLALAAKVGKQHQAEGCDLAALDAPEPGITPGGIQVLALHKDNRARREALEAVDQAPVAVRGLHDRVIDVVAALCPIARDDERSFAVKEACQPRCMFSSHVGTVAQADLREIAVKRLRQEVLAL